MDSSFSVSSLVEGIITSEEDLFRFGLSLARSTAFVDDFFYTSCCTDLTSVYIINREFPPSLETESSELLDADDIDSTMDSSFRPRTSFSIPGLRLAVSPRDPM